MSTLRCTNLQDTSGGNSLTTAQIYNGAAKAWVNFNGIGAIAIRASFNVSSITDAGVGEYTVNLTNSLTDSNYIIAIASQNFATNVNTANNIHQGLSPSTTSFRIQHIESAATADCSFINASVFR